MAFSPFPALPSATRPAVSSRRRTILFPARCPPAQAGRTATPQVTQVRLLIQTTTFSYVEIAKRTGVPSATVARR